MEHAYGNWIGICDWDKGEMSALSRSCSELEGWLVWQSGRCWFKHFVEFKDWNFVCREPTQMTLNGLTLFWLEKGC